MSVLAVIDERYVPKYWDVGEEHSDDVRILVDNEVREALIEYFRTARLTLDYRMGGAPTISFAAETSDFDPIEGTKIERDLGDVIFAELQDFKECGPHVMAELFTDLLDVYECWRAKRMANDPDCNIPVPTLIDDKPAERAQ